MTGIQPDHLQSIHETREEGNGERAARGEWIAEALCQSLRATGKKTGPGEPQKWTLLKAISWQRPFRPRAGNDRDETGPRKPVS